MQKIHEEFSDNFVKERRRYLRLLDQSILNISDQVIKSLKI